MRRHDGEARGGLSGPCTFSQRQGHINLDLKNGDSISLKPTGKQGEYRDQDGERVVRTLRDDRSQAFAWHRGRTIVLTFAGDSGAGRPPAGGGGGLNRPVPSLGELVGAEKGRGGYQMQQRGYTFIRTQTTGNKTLEFWQERENGQCVAVDLWDNRYTSLSFAEAADCRGGAVSGGGAPAAAAGRPDSFDTICCVIVNGKTYRYRCGATDFHAGGWKLRTELRYPDQTIQLTWRSDNRVGLQFEGMVPMEARYATSEGETNWVFEGKTYFYYSDKGLAQREWQSFRE